MMVPTLLGGLSLLYLTVLASAFFAETRWVAIWAAFVAGAGLMQVVEMWQSWRWLGQGYVYGQQHTESEQRSSS